MAGDQNPFGGKNRHSLYVPMTETEQEVIQRLIDAGDLHVHILDWGVVYKPRITFGDLRIAIAFRMNFDRPEVPIPVHFFDLELRTGSGLLLAKQRQPTLYNGNPIQVCAGMFLDLIWDLAIQQMDPEVVKSIKPGAIGLTTREGNMHLNTRQQALYHLLRKGEEFVRQDTAQQVAKAVRRAKRPKRKA